MLILKDKCSECVVWIQLAYDRYQQWQLRPSFLSFLSSWMTSCLPKNDTAVLLPVANMRHSPLHTLSPLSNGTIWPDSNIALTISSDVKVVHHPGSNTYSQKQCTQCHWNNRKVYDSFSHVYASPNQTNGYKILRRREGKEERNKMGS
jgi:hypothetical protein